MASQHSIFIGYRRDDTADVSGRVYDRLRLTFGAEAVFKDVDNLDPGVAFGDYILTILPRCRVFLAMIGPHWADVRNEHGARRLEDSSDWVRIELETALATPGLQVVPVLVNGAPMPRAEHLPEKLRRLPALNAAIVRRDPDFHKDMDKLIRALEAGMATGRVEVEAPQAALAGSAAAWRLIADSLDIHDYTDFQTHFPGTQEVILAGRQRRQLDAWSQIPKRDPDAIAEFLQTGVFPALERLAREAKETAAQAKQQALAVRTRPGAVWRDAIPGLAQSVCPELVTIPPGRFLMGSPAGEEGRFDTEGPQREVRIDHAFALGKHAVTVDEFVAFQAETKHATGGSAYIWNGQEWKDKPGKGWRDPGFAQSGRHPVCCVSWHDAQAYIGWLNGKLGLIGGADAYRLPSEAEWEYACRAGTTTPFSFGATISTTQANYDGHQTYGAGQKGEYRERTTPVGSFAANAFGLHDMHGNVWEWCEDVWHENYAGAPADGSAWIAGGNQSSRVLRGGSWSRNPLLLRSAYRSGITPSVRFDVFGFRLARTV